MGDLRELMAILAPQKRLIDFTNLSSWLFWERLTGGNATVKLSCRSYTEILKIEQSVCLLASRHRKASKYCKHKMELFIKQMTFLGKADPKTFTHCWTKEHFLKTKIKKNKLLHTTAYFFERDTERDILVHNSGDYRKCDDNKHPLWLSTR